MTTLYGAPGSPFVRKVRVALLVKNLSYDFELIIPFGEGVSEEFKKISPLGKIPALRIDGINIADSSVICAYLEKKYPHPAFYPEKPADYAKALWLEEYADTALFSTITKNIFFPTVIAPRLLGEPCDESKVRKALVEDLPPLCAYLENQLNDNQTFIPGLYSIADIAIVSQFVNLYHAEHEIDKKRYPKLAQYVQHHMDSDYFAELIEEEKAFASM